MSKSELELAFEHWLRVFGVERWEREYRFCEGRRWRWDFAWPSRLVAVEIDGGRWSPYGGRHAGDEDKQKHNAGQLLGWMVLRFSGQMIHDDPAGCVEQVQKALKGGTNG